MATLEQSSLPLFERVALVTGAAERVGREIAFTLAEQGCDIIIHYNHSAELAEELANDIRTIGRQAWTLQGDFTSPEDAEIVLRSAWDLAGWVDIVVNNAAIFELMPFAETTLEDYQQMLNVNALAPIVMAKTLYELVNSSEILPADYSGKIINITDQRIHKSAKGCLPYWMSKKALEDFTIGAALELAPQISINAIAPGPVLSPKDAANSEPAGALPTITRCLPSDIAKAVIYLVTSLTITGQVLYVDSGQHLL